jgi:DNA polymerase-3 subunit epsilon
MAMPFMSNGNKILVFDTETTGFPRSYRNSADIGQEILQLAMVDGEGRTLFNEMFKPERMRIWLSAQQVHGISPDMVKEKSPAKAFRKEIQGIIDEADLLVAYNFTFDQIFLRSIGISFVGKQYFDVMKVFAQKRGTPDHRGRRRYTSLKNCAAHYGYKCENAHNAEADALATLACFQGLIAEAEK